MDPYTARIHITDTYKGYYPYIEQIKLTRHPNNYAPWYEGAADVYWVAYLKSRATGTSQLGMWKGSWNYICWKLTWTGWRSSLKWRTWGHRISPSITGENIK